MKLSEKTLTILDNFSKISTSAYFFAGKTQKVMRPNKTIVAEAGLEEEFPIDFGIYDMSKFLSIFSLFKDPELEFTEKFVKIKDSSSEATYWFTSKELISNVVIPPEKSISLKSVDLTFELSKADLKYLKSSASVLGLTDFIINCDGESINLDVKEADNKTSNQITKKVGTTTETFQFVGQIDNLQMLEDDYDVKVSKAGIIEFKSKNNKLTYWVPIRK